MKRAAPGCKVCKHDTDVDGAGKDASTETTNTARSDLCNIDGSNDGSLTDADTRDESTSVDLSESAAVGHEDDDSDNPDETELTSGPETTNAVSDKESEESTSHTADLDHGRDVALDVGQLDRIELLQSEGSRKRRRRESTTDQTLVNTTGGSHDTEREDCQP